jgi:hypothetical protein
MEVCRVLVSLVIAAATISLCQSSNTEVNSVLLPKIRMQISPRMGFLPRHLATACCTSGKDFLLPLKRISVVVWHHFMTASHKIPSL